MRVDGRSVKAARTTSAAGSHARQHAVSAEKGHSKQHFSSAISTNGQSQGIPSTPRQDDLTLKDIDQVLSSPHSRRSNSSTQSPSYSPFDADFTITSPATRETTPWPIATGDDDIVGTLTFSPGTTLLLESCKTARGRFLKEIEQTRTTLPTGQGWEAAIATKVDNADLRDLTKIFHRFECYNIYIHVVEAGYHTGTHWIRDMRITLSNKLCKEFPKRFPNQKAVNKSLNWVDQGCKYHEWAGHFNREGTALGHLIAMPLDVPHSAYTSRCTREQMRSTAIKLKSLGIDHLVKRLELAELGDHIAATLKDMTCKKRKDIPDVNRGSRKLPRSTSDQSLIQTLAVSTGQESTTSTSPATNWDDEFNDYRLETGYLDTLCDDGQAISANVCHPMSEAHVVPYNSPFNLLDLSPSTFSELLQSPYCNAAVEPCNDSC